MIRVGLGYDDWLNKLLTMHGDAAVNRGGAGYVDASVGIPLLEVREDLEHRAKFEEERGKRSALVFGHQ